MRNPKRIKFITIVMMLALLVSLFSACAASAAEYFTGEMPTVEDVVGYSVSTATDDIVTLADTSSSADSVVLLSSNDDVTSVASGYWADYADTDWYTADPSVTSFEITTSAQLAGLANLVNDGEDTFRGDTITIAADIDLSAHEWKAIGTSWSYGFEGTFDGDGHAISGLYIYDKNTDYIYDENTDPKYLGLFGYVAAATIKNVAVSGDIYAYAEVSYSEINAGGIAGYAAYSTIENCSFAGSVDVAISAVDDTSAGGIIANIHVGGIVGSNASTYVLNCYNTGSLKGLAEGSVYSSDNININVRVGGIAGYSISTIKKCYNTGDVTAINNVDNVNVKDYAGGIAGYNNGTIENCYSTGDVIAYSGYSAYVYVGGIAGYNNDTISNSFAHDYVKVNGATVTSSTLVGYDAKAADVSIAQPITGMGGTLVAGSYYLANDITTTETITISENVNLNLNGYSITNDGSSSSSVITVSSGVTFNLFDSQGYGVRNSGGDNNASPVTNYGYWSDSEYIITSEIPSTEEYDVLTGGIITGGTGTVNSNTYTYGGGIYSLGTVNMFGGTIAGNRLVSEASSVYGGGIYSTTLNIYGGTIAGNYLSAYYDSTGAVRATAGGGGASATTFYMNGGEIVNNYIYSGYNKDGGGVYATYVTVDGGEISNNTASSGGGVYASSTFTMDGGEISNNTASYSGGGAYVSSTFTMNGGEISNNTASYSGGGVNTYNAVMNGGEITGNTAGSLGLGISITGSSFTMTDGTISGNTKAGTTTSVTGGVWLQSSADMTMTGGTITANTGYFGGGIACNGNNEIYLSGMVYVAGNSSGDIYLPTSSSIYIVGELEEGSSIGVYTGSSSREKIVYGGTYTDDDGKEQTYVITADDASCFYESYNSYSVIKNYDADGNIKSLGFVKLAVLFDYVDSYGGTVTVYNTGDVIYDDTNVSSDNKENITDEYITSLATMQWKALSQGTTYIEVDGTEQSSNTLSAGNYYLADDMETTATIRISGTVNLSLNGKTIEYVSTSQAPVITLSSSSSVLNLYGNNEIVGYGYWATINDQDITTEEYTIVSSADNISVAYDTLTGGIITGGNGANSGGGVYVSTTSEFNMYGGSIVGNTAMSGGGVYVNTGNEFNMYGGTIAGNTTSGANYMYGGGGVYVTCSNSYSSAIFNMYDGIISNNISGYNGGGVYVYSSCSSAQFNMFGGTISGNTASYNGGGVAGYGGTLNISGGEITENSATNSGGGGVYLTSSSIFNLSGGEITENTATSSGYGGGVYLENGTFNISGSPVISGNTKGTSVNNVLLLNGQIITVSGELTDGAEIGVSVFAEAGKFASGTITESDATYFTSDNAGCVSLWDEGENAINLYYLITDDESVSAAYTYITEISDQVYTGAAIQPTVSVKRGTSSSDLSSSNYTVSYEDNTAVGTATVTITGTGSYYGSVSTTFGITLPTLSENLDNVFAGYTDEAWYVEAPTLSAVGDYTFCDTFEGTYASSITLNGVQDGTDSSKYTQTVYVKDGTSYYEVTLTYYIDAVTPSVDVTPDSENPLDYTISNGAAGSVSDTIYSATVTVDGVESKVDLTTDDNGTYLNITKKGVYVVTATSQAGATSTTTITIHEVTYGDDGSILIADGGSIEKPTAAEVDGYSFSKWLDVSTGLEYDFTAAVTGDIELVEEYTLAAPTVEVSANNTSVVFGTDIVLTATPSHGAEVEYSYQWYKGDAEIDGATSDKLTISNVSESGSYNAVVTATEKTPINGGDAQSQDAKAAAAVAVEITQKDLTISAVAQTVTYGEDLADCTVTYTGIVEGDTITAGDYVVTYAKGTTGVNDDKTTITPQNFANDNYNISYESAEVTVEARAITVTIDDKTSVFGENKEDLTFTVTSETTIYGEDEVISIAEVSDVDAGKYDITAESINDNYSVEITKGTYEITKRALSDSYISVEEETRTYTGSAITPTPSYDDSDVAIVAGADGDYTVSYESNINASENASVTITATDDGNYSGSATVTFEISPKAATVTVPTGITKVYSDENPSVTLVLDGFVAEDNISFEYVISADETTGVGDYEINITTKELNNYSVTYTNATMSITQKDLTISAVAQTVTYGEDLEDCTVTYTGIVEGDTITAGDYVVTYAKGTTGVNDDKTTITPQNFANDNYNISYESAEVTVEARAITVTIDDKTSVFGENKEDLTFTVTSETTIYGEDEVISIAEVSDVDAGKYDITAESINDNYSVEITKGTYEITKRALSDSYISVEEETRTYTGSAITPTPSYDDSDVAIVAGADGDYTVSYESNINASENASVTITATDDGNYSGSATVTFEISPKAATVTVPTGITKVYSDENPSVTLVLDGFVAEDNISFEYVISADETTGVGDYEINITTKELNNYSVTYTNATMSITQKALADSMIAEIEDVNWDGVGFEPTVTLSDILSGTETELIASTDYEITWKYKDASSSGEYKDFTDSTFVNAGLYQLTITATDAGNYSGSTTSEFEIIDTTAAVISLSGAEDINGTDVNNSDLFTTWQGETTLAFDITDNGGYVNATVAINGETVVSVSENADSAATGYISSVTNGVNFEYTFKATEIYEVVITAEDNNGSVTTQTVTIYIETEIDEYNNYYNAYVESGSMTDLTAAENYYNSLTAVKQARISGTTATETTIGSNAVSNANHDVIATTIQELLINMVEDAIDNATNATSSSTLDAAISIFENYAENGVVSGLSDEYVNEYNNIVAVDAVADLYVNAPSNYTRLSTLVSSYEGLSDDQKALAAKFDITIDGEEQSISEWYAIYAGYKADIDLFASEVNSISVVKADNYSTVEDLVEYKYSGGTLSDTAINLVSSAIETKLDGFRETIATIESVELLIAAVDSSVTAETYSTFTSELIAAQNAYAALSTTQKSIVDNSAITAAEAALSAYIAEVAENAVQAVYQTKAYEFEQAFAKISTSTSTIAEVEAIIAEYNSLLDSVTTYVSSSTTTALKTTYPAYLTAIESTSVTLGGESMNITDALEAIAENGTTAYTAAEINDVQAVYDGDVLSDAAESLVNNSYSAVIANIEDVISRLDAAEKEILALVESGSIGSGETPYLLADFCFSKGTSEYDISYALIESARMALETLSVSERALLGECIFTETDDIKNIVDSFISENENGMYEPTYETTAEVVSAMKELGYTVVTTGSGENMEITSVSMSAVAYVEAQYQGFIDHLSYTDWTILNTSSVSEDEYDEEYVAVYGLVTKVDTSNIADFDIASERKIYVEAVKLENNDFDEAEDNHEVLCSYDIKLYAAIIVDGVENEGQQIQPNAGESVVVTIPLGYNVDSTEMRLYHIEDDGTITSIDGITYSTSEAGMAYATFSTYSFSTFLATNAVEVVESSSSSSSVVLDQSAPTLEISGSVVTIEDINLMTIYINGEKYAFDGTSVTIDLSEFGDGEYEIVVWDRFGRTTTQTITISGAEVEAGDKVESETEVETPVVTETPSATTSPESSETGSNFPWIWIVLAVLAIGGIAGYVVYNKKKSSN